MSVLKYLLLLALLGLLVYFVPLLWEIGLVGAIGGAVWIFAWPESETPSGRQPPNQ